LLDKGGAEVVGGVVVVRYGGNPMEAIKNVRKKIAQIEPGLPTKILPDGTVSKVKIVPFYDRTKLIQETLGTLSEALTQEILITIIVVLVFLMHLRSSLLIAMGLPLAVFMAFIMMKLFNVDANVMSLAVLLSRLGLLWIWALSCVKILLII
jgi:Cu(I)/Ag(I) efflux system membrane protein CusA/SilA